MPAPEQPLKPKDPTGYPTNKQILDDIGFYETLISGVYDLPSSKKGSPTPMQTVFYGESSGESGYSGNSPVRTVQKTQNDSVRISADMKKTGASPSSYIANPMNYTGVARGTLQMEPARIKEAVDYLIEEEKAGNNILDRTYDIINRVSPTRVSELDALKTLVKEQASNDINIPYTYSIEDIRDIISNRPSPILDVALALAATKASDKRQRLYSQMPTSGKATAEYQSPADKEKYATRVEYYLKEYNK